MQDTEPLNESKPRGTPAQEKPFLWQSRKALAMIRSNVEKHTATALAVYLALTEIASEKGVSKFDTTHAEIMQRSGIRSDRTVKDRLADLKELQLIDVRENWISDRMRGPSSYTVLSIGSHYLALGNGSESVNTLSSNNFNNFNKKKSTRPSAAIPAGYDASEREIIELWHEVAVSAGLGFLPVDQCTDAVREALLHFPDAVECRALFEFAVRKEREKPSRRSKTLVRVLNDAAMGGYFGGWTDEEIEDAAATP